MLRPFSVRNGLISPPLQFQVGQLPTHTRNIIASVFKRAIEDTADYGSVIVSFSLGGRWLTICEALHVHYFLAPPSTFRADAETWITKLENYILRSPYNDVLDLIEVLVSNNLLSSQEKEGVERAFSRTKAAYRLENDIIITITSEENAAATSNSIKRLKSSAFEGAKTHIGKAAKASNDGDWKAVVRESISAVESVLFKVTNEKSFSKAVGKVREELTAHPALMSGWEKIYGYTSDKDGIRHALLSESSHVDEAEALYMFAVCVSFCDYLAVRLSSSK